MREWVKPWHFAGHQRFERLNERASSVDGSGRSSDPLAPLVLKWRVKVSRTFGTPKRQATYLMSPLLRAGRQSWSNYGRRCRCPILQS
jgi:hypothetical protein